MSRKKLIPGAIKNAVMAAVLFAVFFSAFSTIQVLMEYGYQYTDALNKLAGLEERQAKAIAQANEKVGVYLQRRESALSLLALLLDEGGQAELEAVRPLIGLTALCVTDAQYRVLDGDPIAQVCPDYAAELGWPQDWEDGYTRAITGGVQGEAAHLLMARTLGDGRILIGVLPGEELGDEIDRAFRSLFELRQYTFGEHGFMIGYTPGGAETLYRPETLPEGCTAQSLIAAAEGSGVAFFGGDGYQVIRHDFADGSRYAAFISMRDVCSKRGKTTFLYALIFTLSTMLLYWYAHFLREDEERGILVCGEERAILGMGRRTVSARRMARMTLTAFAALAVMSYYLETFTSASGHRIDNAQRLYLLEQTREDSLRETQEDVLSYDADLVTLAKMAALVLEAAPSLCSAEGAARIADALGVDSIYVFDGAGRTQATNTVFTDFALSSSPEDQSFAFWNVVRGYDEVCIQEAQADDTAWHREMQYVGVARRDAPGMVQLGVEPDEYRKGLSMPLLSVIREMPAMGDGAFYFLVDEQGLIQGWPSQEYDGGPPQRLGLTEEELADGYSGYQWLADRQYFLTCRRIGEEYAFIAVPKRSVYGNDVAVMQVSVVMGMLIMAAAALLILVKRRIVRRLAAGRKGGLQESDSSGTDGGWDGAFGRFRCMNANEKLEALLRFFAVLAVVAAFLYYRWMDSQQEASSMLAYVLSLKWEHSLNVFSLTYVLWVVSAVYVAALLLCRALRWFMGTMSTRTRTIGVLLGNVLKYGAAFGALFYCLPLIGFNPAAVVATASFISFALTFGAQELIKDFLSGMFIIFEDSLRVGDRVVINGSEGYIEEIGLRMTTLVLEDGNAMMIHNSAVNEFTRRLHLAQVRIELSDPAVVETVRRVLLEELHRFGASLSRVIAEPYLERREEAEGVVLVCAQCRKEDVEVVEYELGGMVRRALLAGGVEGWRIAPKR